MSKKISIQYPLRLAREGWIEAESLRRQSQKTCAGNSNSFGFPRKGPRNAGSGFSPEASGFARFAWLAANPLPRATVA